MASASGICSPCPSRAPMAKRWHPTTTRCPDRRWCSYATGRLASSSGARRPTISCASTALERETCVMADLVAEESVRVGLLGCGHVGSALVRLLQDNAELIEQRAGVHLEVTRVAVRDLGRDRDVPLPTNRFTEDGEAVVTRSEERRV